MRRAILCMFVGLLPSLSQQSSPAQAAGVTGKVVGDDGTALDGATVVFSHVGAVRSKHAWPSVNRRLVVSGADGAFELEGLRYGSYVVCAKAPRSPWLDSCDWGAKPTIIVVSGGLRQDVTIRLRRGAIVPIRLEDPRGILAQNLGKAQGAHLLVGVGGADGLFRPVVLAGEASASKSYQALIPFDQSVKLVLSSSFFQVADERGAPLQRTTSIPIKVTAGQASPTVRVIVTGVRTP